MTSLRTSALLSSLLGFAACAPVQPLIVPDAVGPLPPTSESAQPHGSLIVYSETERPPGDPTDFAPYSDYMLYSMDGKLLRSVDNRISPSGHGPATVELPVGDYRVTTSVPPFGLISVHVVINPSQTTVIDLVNEVLPRSLARGDEERWVRLPNGQVIGSKAE